MKLIVREEWSLIQAALRYWADEMDSLTEEAWRPYFDSPDAAAQSRQHSAARLLEYLQEMAIAYVRLDSPAVLGMSHLPELVMQQPIPFQAASAESKNVFAVIVPKGMVLQK